MSVRKEMWTLCLIFLTFFVAADFVCMFQIIFQVGFENKYIFSANIELHFCVVYLCCLATGIWIPKNQKLLAGLKLSVKKNDCIDIPPTH